MAGDKENQSGERDQEKTRKGEIERDREQGKGHTIVVGERQ